MGASGPRTLRKILHKPLRAEHTPSDALAEGLVKELRLNAGEPRQAVAPSEETVSGQ